MKCVFERSALHTVEETEKVKQIAVYDNDGYLLVIMLESDQGFIAVSRAGEEDFNRLAAQMGIKQNVQVTSLK